MRLKIMIILAVLILGVLNYGIYQKEQIKSQGVLTLLALAPLDPRSLMQGDYMQLRYQLSEDIDMADYPADQQSGYMVIRRDTQNVAQFIRFHQGEVLKTDELLLAYHSHRGNIKIQPDSFLFQEGHAAPYQQAKYGIFRLDPSGNHLLVGLADENYQEISP